MADVENRTHVDASVEETFRPWTRPEELPRFLRWLSSVERDGDQLRWRGSIAGVDEEWVSSAQLDDRQAVFAGVGADRGHLVAVHVEEAEEGGAMVTLRRMHPEDHHSGAEGLAALHGEVLDDLDRFRAYVEVGELALAVPPDTPVTYDELDDGDGSPVDLRGGVEAPSPAGHRSRDANRADNQAAWSRERQAGAGRAPADWEY